MKMTNMIAVLAALCCLAVAPMVVTVAGKGNPPETSANYAPPFQTAAHPALLALPPGTIEPRGWLRDWALSVKDGYTACMDDVHEEFKRAWTPECTPTGEIWPGIKARGRLKVARIGSTGLVELAWRSRTMNCWSRPGDGCTPLPII